VVHVRLVDVMLVIEPVALPLIDAVSRSGAEMRDVLLAVPVPAVMLIVRKPIGSVVAF
jgi:hypothetical protein